jgi:hypothetical protein
MNRRVVKNSIFLAAACIFGLTLAGCASVEYLHYVRSDPFQIGESAEESFIVRVDDSKGRTGETVRFNNTEGDSFKINGINIPTNEALLPMAPSYRFEFLVETKDRSFLGFKEKSVIQADVSYAFKPDRVYNLFLKESVGSQFSAAFFGILSDPTLVVILSEYSPDLSGATEVGEFTAETVESNW